MTIDITTLFTAETAARILSAGLELASALGLPVTSWRVGDPSRTLFRFVADQLAIRDELASTFIRSGFLHSSTGDWLTLVASEVYGVERVEATYATPTVTLTNGGGGVYAREAGEVIVKASSTGVTFRSTEALALALGPGTSQTIAFVADSAGSDGTVGVNDIDEIVSTMLGVTITASTAAVGIDEQSDSSLVEECESTLGALSPNGPPDAYNAVVLNSSLTGRTDITRAITIADASDGTVTVYIAGDSGAVSGAAVAAAQSAVELWATPACITPTVVSATNAPQTVEYSVSCDGFPASAEADIEAFVAAHFAALAIGGYVSESALVTVAQTYLVEAGATDVEVTLVSPTGGDLADGYVATVDSVTVNEV